MSTPDDVPYADPEPLPDLVEGCRCVEAECAAHGVGLHPDHHCGAHPHAAPVVIDEATWQLVDGYPDYGS
jgi:hypothetical protein